MPVKELRATVNDFKSSYMYMASASMFLLFLDLMMNCVVDTDDLQTITRSPNLDVSMAIYAGQVAIQILAIWMLFLLVSATTVFQVLFATNYFHCNYFSQY